MNSTVPNATSVLSRFVVGAIPACPAWCADADDDYHRTLDRGARVHESHVGGIELDGPEGRVTLHLTLQQCEGTGDGAIYRESTVFVLRDIGEKYELIATEDSDELRRLSALLLSGADQLDAAHAADAPFVS